MQYVSYHELQLAVLYEEIVEELGDKGRSPCGEFFNDLLSTLFMVYAPLELREWCGAGGPGKEFLFEGNLSAGPVFIG